MKVVVISVLIGAAALGVPVFAFIWWLGASQPTFHGPPDWLIACIYGCPASVIGMVVGGTVGMVIHVTKKPKPCGGARNRKRIGH